MFDKIFYNRNYNLFFNTKTGLQVIEGIKEDPFFLELPALLDVGIMGTCQNKCSFCYQGHKNKQNMKLKDFKRIIDEVKHHTNQVALGGRGDPNKHKNFKEIVEYARNNNVVPNYTTSGINLTDEEVEISKLCGSVAVSQYNKEYTYRAIDMFIKSGIKTNIHFIFSTKNYSSSIKILTGQNIWNKIDQNKLNALVFLLFKPQGAGKNLKSNIPTRSMLKHFSELILKPRCKFKVGMDSCLVNHLVQFKKLTSTQKMILDTCEGSRMSAYISPDMFLVPCSFADKSIWGASLEKRSIHDIWNNSECFKKFRNKLKENPEQCPLGL